MDVVASERTWNYVLLHGDDELQSGWRAEWLTVIQAKQLLSIIEPNVHSASGLDLLRRLHAIVVG